MNSDAAGTMAGGLIAKDVAIEISGTTYIYFMTNDFNALTYRLRDIGCHAPKDTDFKKNPDLLKPVHDAMCQLGATYSLTVSHNAYAMNHCIPGKGIFFASLLDLCDTTSSSPSPKSADSLMLSVARNDSATVAQLIQQGAIIDEVSPQGLAPLMVAARFNAMDTARLLIDNGVNLDILSYHGRTSLCYAVRYRSFDVARLLVERGANIDARDNFGLTPLIEAIQGKSVELATMLVQNGANVNLGGIKNTPLMDAIQNNSLDIIRLLISHGVNLNRRNIYGSTPLMVAREKGFTEAAQLLADAGAKG